MIAPEAPRVVDVQEFIDAQPLSGLQKLLLILCFLVVAIDGFDTAIIGFIAPAIRAEWGLQIAQLGPLFAAGLSGLMIGAFAAGPLADRHGRKTLLVASMLLFGGASLASALSTGLQSLTWLRFATGVGLGGAMPTTITIASEYCPKARRSSLVTLMFCGFTIGSAMGGFIASHVLPVYGWRALLVGGGVAPLLLAPVLGWVLPESVRYLVMKGNAQDQREAGAESDRADRPAPRCDVRGCSCADGVASTAAPQRRPLRRDAASVDVVLHEPVGRVPPDQLDADTDSAVRCVARERRTYGGDVPDRRNARGDPRRPVDGSLRAARCALRHLPRRGGIRHSHQPYDDDTGADDVRRIRRRSVRVWRPGGRERVVSGVLSDAIPRDRRQLGKWHRPQRIDRRLPTRRNPSRSRLAADHRLRAGRDPRHHFCPGACDTWGGATAATCENL